MKVTVYSQNNCVQCGYAKKHLDAIGVRYTEKNISTNDVYKQELIEQDFRGVPVIEVKTDDGFTNHIIGFRPNELDKLK